MKYQGRFLAGEGLPLTCPVNLSEGHLWAQNVSWKIEKFREPQAREKKCWRSKCKEDYDDNDDEGEGGCEGLGERWKVEDEDEVSKEK